MNKVSKIVAGGETKINHRERRLLAKKLALQSVCKKHQHPLTLHGTELICDVCRIERRVEKQKEKSSKIEGLKKLFEPFAKNQNE